MSGIRNRGALPMRNKHKVNDLIFYTLMVAFPLAQFCVFYISVNINSILLAFRSYSSEDGGFVWAQFGNFANIFRDFAASATLKTAMLNSLLVWAASTAVSLPLAMLFSYYIYNKRPASGVFKTLLFMPSVIPGIAITVIYLYFVERAIPAFAADVCGITVEGLLQNPATRFGAIFFYNVFLSFGGNVILLLGGMNTVDPSVREAAYLDGAKGWCEFRHIILPKVWPTLTTFFCNGRGFDIYQSIQFVQLLRYRCLGKTCHNGLLAVCTYIYCHHGGLPRTCGYGLVVDGSHNSVDVACKKNVGKVRTFGGLT